MLWTLFSFFGLIYANLILMVWEKFVVLSEMTSNRRAFVGENKCHEHSLLLLHPGKKKDGDKYAHTLICLMYQNSGRVINGGP
jgi:hypothetical protein